VHHDWALGGTRAKTVVKRTAMGKPLRFFFTMFSISDLFCKIRFWAILQASSTSFDILEL
jgi:hypothetical protein